jgi:hypothetical protein
MDELSGGEFLLLLVAGGLALSTWPRWLANALAVRPLHAAMAPRLARLAGWLVPAAALGLLQIVLRTLASSDVRGAPFWIGYYTLLGAAWIATTFLWLPITGFDPRGDVLERGNPAASVAWAGAVFALTAAYAGANVGDGPGWWVVVGCALAASWPIVAIAGLMAGAAGAAERITVDRDLAAAFRFAALLLGAGLVLGRSVAGDWHGADAAFYDHVAAAWPTVPAVWVALRVERAVERRPSALGRWLPGVGYLAAAAAWTFARGAPP